VPQPICRMRGRDEEGDGEQEGEGDDEDSVEGDGDEDGRGDWSCDCGGLGDVGCDSSLNSGGIRIDGGTSQSKACGERVKRLSQYCTLSKDGRAFWRMVS